MTALAALATLPATKTETTMKRTEKIEGAAPALDAAAKSLVIQQPRRLVVALEVAGTASLIQNKFSQKAIEEMLRKHMGFSVQREKKKPREIIENATIRNVDGRVCVPPTAFKKAMLTAAGSLKTLKKTQLRTQLFVLGQSIPITYTDQVPRMDIVRTSGMARTPDVRFRPEFVDWKARLRIEFDDVLAVQTVVDLLYRAGSVGLGEWRPEKDGVFGTFQVTRNITDREEIEEVRQQCAVELPRPRIPEWALDADIDPDMLQQAMDDIAGGRHQSEERSQEGQEAEEESGARPRAAAGGKKGKRK
jgi:hypothetical protein